MLGMIMGIAKIVRALRCLDAPCKYQQQHIQHQSLVMYAYHSGKHGGNGNVCLTIPAVSIAVFAVD